MKKSVLFNILALAVVLALLSGCFLLLPQQKPTPNPQPTPTPNPDPEPEPTPTPTPEPTPDPDPVPGPEPEPVPDPEPEPENKPNQSTVTVFAPPSGVQLYQDVSVLVENTSLPLYSVKVNNVHSWSPNPTTSRSDSGVGYFALRGNTQVSVSAPNMTSCIVRPLSAGVTAKVENGVATFTLSSAGNYSVEPNGDATKAIFLFVSATDTQPTATGNVIRFGKGVHTSQNSSHINNNTVELSSNTTVILEDGAVVRARFVANNASNITICGRGIVDGSTFVRNASTGEVTVPLDFNYCSNITLKDFSVLDPAGWCVNWYFCTDSHIDGIKIITSRSNGDGISLQSCKNIRVENCFLRTWDDSLVVKNYPRWYDRNQEGSTDNITFANCTVWTDLAQSMEVGYETVGQTLQNVTFQNITVLHNFHKPVISIHNGNNANVYNIIYDTITVEDASMGRGDAGNNSQLCEFAVEFNSTWSTQHKTTALGSVDTVTVKNLTVFAGNAVIGIRIAGSLDLRDDYVGTIHNVSNVSFQNVWINGKSLRASQITKNSYVSNITIAEGQQVVVPFVFSLAPEVLETYTSHAEVTVR